MPATSRAMQQAAAIALHHPEKLKARNRSMLRMTDEQLREYASTSHQGLPKHNLPLAALMRPAKRRK